MIPPKRDLHRITTLLESHEWVFAKTMPQNPHWYTLRRKWADDQAFAEAVQFIRQYGRRETYPPGSRNRYTVMVMGGFKYWTMGWPVEKTILINRKPVPGEGSGG